MSSEREFFPYHPEPLLIVISGPSGVGKDTVIDGMRQRGLPFHFVVTVTTRLKRKDEKHGEDYFFVSKEEFAEMIENGELIEYAIVYQDYKGVPKQQVRDALNSGKDVVMRVDVQGAETVRKLVPQALLIFLLPTDENELEQRLYARRSEDEKELKLRITMARQELKKIDLFDYVVINKNDHLGETLDVIEAIIVAERHRVNQRKINL